MIINQARLLVAAPILHMEPCKVQFMGTSYGLSEAGYDIRIKQSVVFCRAPFQNGMSVAIADPTHAYPGGTVPEQEGRFALASAIEEFSMPDNLVGVVHDKSTWARRGLSVFNTVIEPGWKGFLTLELVYHGSGQLIIPAGSGIAQVLFHQLAQPQSYAGKYQNQENKPVPAKDS